MVLTRRKAAEAAAKFVDKGMLFIETVLAAYTAL